MDYYVSLTKQQIASIIRFLEAKPFITIIISVLILFITIARVDLRKTSAGSWGIIIFACMLFIWGISCLTGARFSI